MITARVSTPHQQPDDVATWTTSLTHSRDFHASATDVYARGVEFFEKELNTEKARDIAWIKQSTTIDDVRRVVVAAQTHYRDTRSEKAVKVRKAVDAFALCITSYSGVLDVVANADPLHAGLAWGAIRFVLDGVLYHSQLLAELSNALARIGDVLPRVKIDSFLYQIPWMQTAVARLYGHIIAFLKQTMKWYNASSARRAIATILRSDQLSFQETAKQIEACTEAVEAVAKTAERVEIRGITCMMRDLLDQQSRSAQDFQGMQSTLAALQANYAELLLLARQSHDLHTQGTLRAVPAPNVVQVMAQSRLIEDSHSVSLTETSRNSGSNRLKELQWWRQSGRDTQFTIQQLTAWARAPESAIFIARVGPRAATRAQALTMEVSQILEWSGCCVISYIASRMSQSASASIIGILRSLVISALRSQPALFSEDPSLLDPTILHEQHSESEWTALATRVLMKIPRFFLIVDADNVNWRNSEADIGSTRLFVKLTLMLENVSRDGGVAKLLWVSYGNHCDLMASQSLISFYTTLQAPLPVSRRRPGQYAIPLRVGRGRGELWPAFASRG